ncbi:unnamed protein product [Peronospora belbahrii]|uniref:Uncharacterized protein n=1 Tax=Peronospora belbahrii TaxID=622444 RepID=A0AAU9L235_9STRA|nr:unnamed protein product [Peronospora belbahrii]
MRQFFDDTQLVKIAHATSNNPLRDRNGVLHRVVKDLLVSWYESSMIPNAAHLQLNNIEGNIFESDCFAFWLNYVDHFNVEEGRGKGRSRYSALSLLTEKYGNASLVKWLKEAIHTKTLKPVTKPFLDDLTQMLQNTYPEELGILEKVKTMSNIIAADKKRIFVEPEACGWRFDRSDGLVPNSDV